MDVSKIEIKGDPNYPVRAEVYVDGIKVPGVKELRYRHKAGELPEVHMTLLAEVDIEEMGKVEIEQRRDCDM